MKLEMHMTRNFVNMHALKNNQNDSFIYNAKFIMYKAKNTKWL